MSLSDIFTCLHVLIFIVCFAFYFNVIKGSIECFKYVCNQGRRNKTPFADMSATIGPSSPSRFSGHIGKVGFFYVVFLPAYQ